MIKWTNDAITAEAQKFSNRYAFALGSPKAYDAAKRAKLLDKFCAHMGRPLGSSRAKIPLDEIAAEALKYATHNEFMRGSPSYFNAARKRGIRQFCDHMQARRGGFDRSRPGTFYYARINSPSGIFWKVGITNLDIHERFSAKERKMLTVIHTEKFDDGFACKARELSVLRAFRNYRHNGPKVLFGNGDTELFPLDILGLDPELSIGVRALHEQTGGRIE